jgi:hypothetical protein
MGIAGHVEGNARTGTRFLKKKGSSPQAPVLVNLMAADIRFIDSSETTSDINRRRYFAASGVQLAETDRGQFHFRRAAFSAQLKSRVDLTLGKSTVLRTTLNLDGVPIIYMIV